MSKYINTQLLNSENIIFDENTQRIFDACLDGTAKCFYLACQNNTTKTYLYIDGMTFTQALELPEIKDDLYSQPTTPIGSVALFSKHGYQISSAGKSTWEYVDANDTIIDGKTYYEYYDGGLL